MSQDISAAVRPVLFDTTYDEFPYSFGGTLFIITFRGRCYGLTCNHTVGDQGAERIIVFKTNPPAVRDLPIRVQTLARIDAPDNDLGDVAVLGFSNEFGPSYFGQTAYNINLGAVGTSWSVDELRIFGCLNTKSIIDTESESINISFCDLQCRAVGRGSTDPFLCQASATLAINNFTSLDGISGAPVFNRTRGQLCGMVVRAGLSPFGKATVWYIDIGDIMKLVEAVAAGSFKLDYLKYPLK